MQNLHVSDPRLMVQFSEKVRLIMITFGTALFSITISSTKIQLHPQTSNQMHQFKTTTNLKIVIDHRNYVAIRPQQQQQQQRLTHDAPKGLGSCHSSYICKHIR